MAKKKKKNQADSGDLASEEILDSLAKGDEGDAADEAAEDEAEATVEASSEHETDEAEASADEGADEPVVPVLSKRTDALQAEFLAWPVDKDHDSAASFLRGDGAGDPSKVVLEEEDEARGKGGALNFILMILIIAAGVGGVIYFRSVSSPEALAAKKAEREAIEQAHLEEQLAKQKKYGVLRIESNPAQATVFKDGEKIVSKSEATGEEVIGKTPMNLMDLDISVPVKIRLEAEGYAPYDFAVAEHLWTKDAATGEYKYFTLVEMTPNVCEYWFLYDAKKKRELQFPDDEKETGKSKCTTYYDEAAKGGTAVTECTCKIPPEGWEPPNFDKDKKKK
ncbi:MAG: hypothetical protein KC613_15770 [Myxococcales bacterium]|nr:hypothetical protein [Myxococcales bacterium]MCB9525531.1 hypothetical protein [Myxococcales bacterium]